MRKPLPIFITLAWGIVFLISTYQISFAQEDEDSFTLEEITVTSQKRTENVQDVPLAITVTNREQLERQQINAIVDLERITPALEINNPNRGPSGSGFIRGIGTVTEEVTATGSVAVVVDDVPGGDIPNPNVFDVERVEVLKGPQGTLFGQAASAGVINMVTVAPDLSGFSGNIHLEYADKGTLGSRFGQQLLRGAVNVPLSETSALRISAMGNIYEGIHENVYNNEEQKDRNYGVRARYLYEPSEKLTVNLIADYNRRRETGPRLFTILDVVPGSVADLSLQYAGITPKEGSQENYLEDDNKVLRQSKNYGISAQIDYTIADHTLTSITAYREQDNGPDHDIYIFFPPPISPFLNVPEDNTELDQFSQELRITSPANQTLEYVAGLYYFTSDKNVFGDGLYVDIWLPTVAGPNAPPIYINPVQGDGSDFNIGNDSIAAYGQLTWHLTDAASLFSGLRLSQQEISVTQTEHHSGVSGTLSDTDTDISWRIGGQYRFNPQLMAYASATSGYKPMMVSEGTLDASGIALDIPEIIKPEKPMSYEVGLKVSALKNRLAIDLNAYHNTVEDYQGNFCVPNASGGWQCVTKNLSEVVSKGFELELTGRPVRGLSLTSGLIYVSAEYPDGHIDAGGTDVGGEQLVNIPEWKYVLSGDYTMSLTESLLGYLAVGATYRSEAQKGDPASDAALGFHGYWDLGGQIGLRASDNAWSVSLWGRNLLNEYAPVIMVRAPDSRIQAVYMNKSFRQVGISLDYKF